jgi:hypothetical protein
MVALQIRKKIENGCEVINGLNEQKRKIGGIGKMRGM